MKHNPISFILHFIGAIIGFSAVSYSGLEGMSVQPVVLILSGVLATGLSVPVHFITANFQAAGE